MSIYIDTHTKLPEKILNILFRNNTNTITLNIIQLNFNDNNDVMALLKCYENNNTSFINKIQIFKEKNNTIINSLFNKLCVLYLNGGILISNNIVNNIAKLTEIYNNYDICSVKSCIKNELFTGLLCCKKGEEKILDIINTYLNDEKIDINMLLMKLLYENKDKYIVLNEKIMENKSIIYYKEEIIAEHYFKVNNILEIINFKNEIPKDLSKIKIGITLNLPNYVKDFYSNGIRQNCLYLYELLNNMNYDVRLIIDDEKYINVLNEIDSYKFDYVTLKNVFLYEFNLIFTMGFSIPECLFIGLKRTGVKLIYYMCGNNYLIDSEKILYNQHKIRGVNYNSNEKFDQIWIIPQMYNQNKYYCETLHRTKSIQVPFIWSPLSIKLVQKILNLNDEEDLRYKKKDSKIAICEPNISVMKWSLPCLLLAENTYRTYKNIKHIYITNLNRCEPEKSDTNQFNIHAFNDSIRSLDLFKDGKLSAEDRHVTLGFLKSYCDIIISHQWENPLNYLYLEVAWMGWPILHNASLCKDVGYYYEGFNYYEGSEVLNNILIHHDANSKEYLNKNRKVIEQYIPTNNDLQMKYKNLIENLFV